MRLTFLVTVGVALTGQLFAAPETIDLGSRREPIQERPVVRRRLEKPRDAVLRRDGGYDRGNDPDDHHRGEDAPRG